MKKFLTVAVTTLALGASTLVAPTVAEAAPYCGIRWGSQERVVETLSTASLVGVRAGRHACYDRLVFDVSGISGGFQVRYVDEVLDQGQGAVIPVRGGAALEIVLLAPAYDLETGGLTYVPPDRRELVGVQGWKTFRQVAWGGSYEGYTTVALGVRARLPFRVFTLAGPGSQTRIVIDVAHRW